MKKIISALIRFFETRIDPYPDQPPTQPPGGLWAFCWHYSRDAAPWLLLMAVASAVIAFVEVWLFSAAGSLIDRMVASGPARFLADQGDWLWTVAVAAVVVLPLALLLSELVMHQTIAGNYPQRIRWQTHRYLLRQSMSYFQDEFSGRIATKVMQTALAVREVVMKLMDIIVYVMAYFIGAVVLAFSNDWRLAMPFLIWGLCYGAFLRFFVPRLGRISQAQADARSAMTGRIVDSYTNIATVKLFSHAGREEAYVREGMDTFLGTVHGQMRLITGLNVLLMLLNTALLVAVVAIGVVLWQRGTMEVGVMAAMVPLAMRFGGMSNWIMWEVMAVSENVGTVRDGINSISQARLVVDVPDAPALQVSNGAVQFRDVRFGYGDAGRAVLDGLNLSIAPGERVGLIGRSGAGKSTLVNLLLRFYDVDGGAVMIDGQDISRLNQDSLRSAIGVVTQDTSLLHRSVRDNIAYGRPDASLSEVRRAAEMAEADGFIQDLSDGQGRTGYDAHVGERGVKLSGGQRQRIAIARVFLKDAPILVLDEATSALDSEVEAAIQDKLDDLMAGKTVIAIAHRLSTIAAMDRLVVMDQGRIVEMGTHEELLALGGIYAGLWARQSGGFLPETDEKEGDL